MDGVRGMWSLQNKRRMTDGKDSPNQIGLAVWVLKLMRGIRIEREPITKQLHLLETLALGGKRQLMLVSCGGMHFLVGGDMESVETIVQIQGETLPSFSVKKLDRMDV